MRARLITALTPSALLALSPALLLTGCGGGSGPAQAAGAPALTKAQATQVLNSHMAAANKAAERFDGGVLAGTETNPQLEMDTAAYKLQQAIKRKPAAIAYTSPTFYIPRLSGFPRWFVADVTEGKTRRALLFTQDGQEAPWLLTAAPYASGKPLSGIALDRAGFATSVRADDTELGASPTKLATAHAALLTGGPKAPGADGLAVGPQTTQSYDALRKAQDQLKKSGVTLHSQFVKHTTPVYALRTVDGGAMVWYVLQQNESYRATQPGKLAVSGDVIGLAPARAARTHLGTTVLIQYLGKVPRRGPATVTGMYRKAVKATAS